MEPEVFLPQENSRQGVCLQNGTQKSQGKESAGEKATEDVEPAR